MEKTMTAIALAAFLVFTNPAFADDAVDHYTRPAIASEDAMRVTQSSFGKIESAAALGDMAAVHKESYTLEEAVKALADIDAAMKQSLQLLAEQIHVHSERGTAAQTKESIAAFKMLLSKL